MSNFIAIDWGSSNIRAYLIVNGECVDKRIEKRGLLYSHNFEDVFNSLVSSWGNEPVLISGMLGSANGWRETKYVSSLEEIPHNLLDISDLIHRPGWIIPGLQYYHTFQDVMRGEETQLVGVDWNGLVILPGTHSKWVWMHRDKLLQFHTQMTGELFALLRERGLIGALIQKDKQQSSFSMQDFRSGVLESQGMGSLLHKLFAVRARGVHGNLNGLSDYLSGLLIGFELSSQEVTKTILVIGNQALFSRYECALSIIHPQVSVFFEDEEEATLRGMRKIWEKKNEQH